MAATREQILEALLAVVASSGSFALKGRRNRAPETIGPSLSPAVFLVKAMETWKRPTPQLQPVRTMLVKAYFYNDVGGDLNAIPEAVINAALDALDALFEPDNPVTGRFTLGGLVYSCMIAGDAKFSAGEITGKSLGIVPIEIVIP